MYIYIFAFIGTLIESMSDILLKNYTKNEDIIFLMGGLLGYIFTGLMFLQLLKFHNLGSANIIWHVIHFIILFTYSILFLDEEYNTRELIGIIFGLISFYLIGMKNH
tara:strand:+ start:2023 stop:2343 length:321 start_codon:yes stop_codon:yes gene_type:complete